ncbi:MAG: hypothetical protein Q9166_000287 [cf. Caloplaca sp. 2 TL-2023]
MATDLDDATATTILATQLQDVEDLNGSYNYEEGEMMTDEHYALRAYQQELERLRDHRIAILFGESPMGNEELPALPDAPPSSLRSPKLDTTVKQTPTSGSLEPSQSLQQPSDQNAATPAPGVLGLDCQAMEHENLLRKRKTSTSPVLIPDAPPPSLPSSTLVTTVNQSPTSGSLEPLQSLQQPSDQNAATPALGCL